jgi:DNA-binding response OmpR family regulator
VHSFAEYAISVGPSPDEIPVLRWPEEDERRQQLAARNAPRMLLVSSSTAAPMVTDEMEDWLRLPADPTELRTRAAALAHRASGIHAPPRLDPTNGLVRRGHRWVAISEPQWPVVRILVERMGGVVTYDEILAVYESARRRDDQRAVKSMMWRLGHRLRPIGLVIHTVRGRGYLADVAPMDP